MARMGGVIIRCRERSYEHQSPDAHHSPDAHRVIAAALPPAIMGSASPRSMKRYESYRPSPSPGSAPFAPRRMETCPAARFTMDAGMDFPSALLGTVPLATFEVSNAIHLARPFLFDERA